MDLELRKALVEYGRTIQAHGWRLGEDVISKYEPTIPDFQRWAHAFGIMLRAQELLSEVGHGS